MDCSTPGFPVLHCLRVCSANSIHSATPFIWCVILHKALFSTSSGRLYFPKMALTVCLTHPTSSSHKVTVIPMERWGVCVPSSWIPVGIVPLGLLWLRGNDRCVCVCVTSGLVFCLIRHLHCTLPPCCEEALRSWRVSTDLQMCACMDPLRFQP